VCYGDLQTTPYKDEEIRHHHPPSPAVASHSPVTQTLPSTFVVMVVAVVVVVARAVARAGKREVVRVRFVSLARAVFGWVARAVVRAVARAVKMVVAVASGGGGSGIGGGRGGGKGAVMLAVTVHYVLLFQ
jgi:uncharacterized membrane protein YgcG